MCASNPANDQLFDIHAFDAARLDIPSLLEMISEVSQYLTEPHTFGGWTAILISHQTDRTVLRFDPEQPELFPSLRIKLFRDNPSLAVRTHNILTALYEFGVSTGPRPFYAVAEPEGISGGVMISEWVHGELLSGPPSPDDEEMWHRIMAVMGVLKNLPFAKHASQIPLTERGVQQPQDCIDRLDNALKVLPTDHPDRSMLTNLVDAVREQVAPQWLTMPKVALSRLDPSLEHFIWDGYHLRGIGWSGADWADIAFDLAQIAAHPTYEEVPRSHWVWFRWEYGRLTHDQSIVARATTYTQLLYLYWAIHLTTSATSIHDGKLKGRLLKQRNRYLKQAQHHFG